MKCLFFFINLLFLFSTMNAQTKENITGSYYLEGVMETASGFKLNSDSGFEFFFSYGALDRYGSGKWNRQDDFIVFNSKPYPGSDFKLLNSAKENSNFTTVKIENENPSLNSFVYCLLTTKDGDSMINADKTGIITLPGKQDSIHLLFELCPERISSFANNTASNVFTFRFEPWIVEVFFKDFILKWVDGHLEGNHPLLRPGKYKFIKDE